MTVQVLLGVLSTEGGRNTWLCTVRASSPTPAPELRVVRALPVRPGRKPNAAVAPPSETPPPGGFVTTGSLTLTEQDRTRGTSLAPVTSDSGEVTLTLRSAPTSESSSFGWDLTLTTRVEKGLELHVFARDAQGVFQEVASLRGTVFPDAQLNARTAPTVRAIVKPVPRLSVGLIQTPTPPIQPEYRKVKPGSGDPLALGTDPSAENLQALLYRVFYLLDLPGTLNSVWDNETGTSSLELDARAHLDPPDVAAAEELWARQVAEMLLGVPYDSPTNVYDRDRPRDPTGKTTTLVKPLGNLPFCGGSVGAGASNPFFGIPFACQQLATFGILSRGEYGASGEIGAASMGSVTVTRMKGTGRQGKWFVNFQTPREITAGETAQTALDPDVLTPDAKNPTDDLNLPPGEHPVDLTAMIKLDDYGPGAVHLFSNASVSENPGAFDGIQSFLQQNPPDPKTGKLPQPHGDDSASKFVPAFERDGKPIVVGGAQCRFLLRVSIKANVAKSSQVLVFPPGKNLERDNQGAAHIGFTLRIRNGKAQFLDTGGLNAPGRETSEVKQLFPSHNGIHGGTLDDPLGVQCKSIASPFRGIGVFGKLTPELAAPLVRHVDQVLKAARPMGLARLYLLKDGTLPNASKVPLDSVLYASPVKPMYDFDLAVDDVRKRADPRHRNYPLSRYAWSLRDLNGKFQAVWVIYVPFRKLTDQMIGASRGTNFLTEPDADLVRQTKVVRGCMNLRSGAVTFLDADALASLTRLEGRGVNAKAEVGFAKAFQGQGLSELPAPGSLPGYFRDG
jgi:hypothetical protein